MLRFDIITIFPEYFREVFDFGIVRRARVAGLVEIATHDLRGWTHDKHRMVDDRPFGGGDGMILKPEPLFEGVEALTGARDARELEGTKTRVVLLTPQGRVFDQRAAEELATAAEQIVLICGRYEGVDERVVD
ncbi:MAG: tRNA (guanosine(37)-N1)-methyltransferase TrmD, partial [Pyrinomonadaceae bacterium]|nr:tRNA (guanosine(37)-N1)-methyltransferase TrmD [Pyrinomonadaceae bacterium]